LSLLDCLFGRNRLPMQHESAQRRNDQQHRDGGDNPKFCRASFELPERAVLPPGASP
jgi:hypothetical protein